MYHIYVEKKTYSPHMTSIFCFYSPLRISLQHGIGEGRVLGVSIKSNHPRVVLCQLRECCAIGLSGGHLVACSGLSTNLVYEV